MITKEKIDSYIEKIPSLDDRLQQTLLLLRNGELVQAAKIAQEDIALSAYLRHLVNTPLYGFRHEVEDINQIFAILGVSGAIQSVYNYMINLLSPKKWELFHLNEKSFHSLQVDLSVNWKKILDHLGLKNKNVESAIALLPASIIIAEALFCEKREDIILLRGVNPLDFNTILKRLTGMDLFDISEEIALKWDMSNEVIKIIQSASGIKHAKHKTIDILAKWMHLLLFFTLSKPVYIEAGLNDFIEFQIEYVEDVYEEFITLMEIE